MAEIVQVTRFEKLTQNLVLLLLLPVHPSLLLFFSPLIPFQAVGVCGYERGDREKSCERHISSAAIFLWSGACD